jgi:hypothetical protein
MTTRSLPVIAGLSLLTGGLYLVYWFVVTKDEMNEQGANIPSAWWILIPFGIIWWLWHYADGVEIVTRDRMNRLESFLLLLFLNWMGAIILQSMYNRMPRHPAIPTAIVHR